MIVDADAQVQFNGPIGILVSYTRHLRVGICICKKHFTLMPGEHTALCHQFLPRLGIDRRSYWANELLHRLVIELGDGHASITADAFSDTEEHGRSYMVGAVSRYVCEHLKGTGEKLDFP
jgi:hypothetical protein